MRLSKKTLLIGLPILILWGFVTAALIDRNRLPAVSFDSAKRLTEPTESWLALFAGRDANAPRIGSIHLQQAPEQREGADGLRFELAVDMKLELFGRSTELVLNGNTWRPYTEPRAEIYFEVLSGESEFRLEGEVRDQRLIATVLSAGESIPLELPVSSNALFSGGFGSALSFPELEVGEEVRVETFDPMTLRASYATVRCMGEQELDIGGEKIAAKILRVDSQGLRSKAWVDSTGEVLRAETALGLTLERTTAEALNAPVDSITANPAGLTAAADFLSLTAIRPAGERPFRGAKSMTFTVRGQLPSQGLPLDSTQQSVGERRYRIASPVLEPPVDAPSTASPSVIPSGASPDASHLSGDAFVQSDHPRIRQAAADLLARAGLDGADAAPEAKARAIGDWVFVELEKEPVLSIPSALEVLEQRRGDCNEHAVLYTALARAAELPTRIAIGIVWSELLNGFYYHAWPEVWIDQRWLWIDPTLGQEVADATHIKLLNGGIESWPQLLPYLGRLEIEVLEIR